MEQENQGAGAPDSASQNTQQADDPIKNLKSEFNRKLGNLEESNRKLMEQLSALVNPKPKAPEPSKLDDVWYQSPAEAARIIKEETRAEIRKELDAERQLQTKQAQVINSLVAEFPELSQQDHDLTKRAVEIYNSLPDDEKQSPIAYKAAVKEAALELDIKPKAKRQTKKEDDSFSFGSGGGSSRRPSSDSEIDKVRESLAEKFGLKMTPELKDKLKKTAKRDFRKFE